MTTVRVTPFVSDQCLQLVESTVVRPGVIFKGVWDEGVLIVGSLGV